MKRLLLLMMATAVVLSAACAFGQTETLYLNDPPSNNSWDGIYTGAYSFTNVATGANQQMICDDFADEQTYAQTTFTVSSFGNWTNTMYGNLSNATQLYEEAAYLAITGVLASTGLAQSYYNFALWAVFQPGNVLSYLTSVGDNAACNAVFGSNCGTVNLNHPGGFLGTAQQNYNNGSVNYSSVTILTPVGCSHSDGGNCNSGSNFGQEFLLVPEGGAAATYLLMAGLSCLGAMWLRNQGRARA